MLYRFSNGNSCEAAILHNSQAEYEYLLQLAEQYYKPVATRAACAGSLYLMAWRLIACGLFGFGRSIMVRFIEAGHFKKLELSCLSS